MLTGVILTLEEVLSRVVTFNRFLKSRTVMEYELQKELDNTSACQSDSVSKAMNASTLSVSRFSKLILYKFHDIWCYQANISRPR